MKIHAAIIFTITDGRSVAVVLLTTGKQKLGGEPMEGGFRYSWLGNGA